MIAVDSSVWVDLLKRRRTPQVLRLSAELDAGEPLAITDVVYMELLRGLGTGAEIARMKLRLGQTRVLRLRELSDFELAAELYLRARRHGHTVRQATDCLIAAVCIRETVPLLHDDVDFDRIADVSDLQVA